MEYTDEFEAWWNTLEVDEQEEVEAKVELLEEFGPVLPRPHADVIVTSKHAKMKELRADVAQRHLRVLYAFDPRRKAILLIGGDKTGTQTGTSSTSRGLMNYSTTILRRLSGSRKRNGTMTKNFNSLREKMRPESLARAHAKAQQYKEQMALDELREARQLTQESLAKILGIKQAAVSKMERRADMYLSTLHSIVKAMGGELRIEAVFPEGTVQINQFHDLRKSEVQHEHPAPCAAAD